jgi:hypothetical protein
MSHTFRRPRDVQGRTGMSRPWSSSIVLHSTPPIPTGSPFSPGLSVSNQFHLYGWLDFHNSLQLYCKDPFNDGMMSSMEIYYTTLQTLSLNDVTTKVHVWFQAQFIAFRDVTIYISHLNNVFVTLRWREPRTNFADFYSFQLKTQKSLFPHECCLAISAVILIRIDTSRAVMQHPFLRLRHIPAWR